jgi:hypothetical protein
LLASIFQGLAEDDIRRNGPKDTQGRSVISYPESSEKTWASVADDITAQDINNDTERTDDLGYESDPGSDAGHPFGGPNEVTDPLDFGIATPRAGGSEQDVEAQGSGYGGQGTAFNSDDGRPEGVGSGET